MAALGLTIDLGQYNEVDDGVYGRVHSGVQYRVCVGANGRVHGKVQSSSHQSL